MLTRSDVRDVPDESQSPSCAHPVHLHCSMVSPAHLFLPVLHYSHGAASEHLVVNVFQLQHSPTGSVQVLLFCLRFTFNSMWHPRSMMIISSAVRVDVEEVDAAPHARQRTSSDQERQRSFRAHDGRYILRPVEVGQRFEVVRFAVIDRVF